MNLKSKYLHYNIAEVVSGLIFIYPRMSLRQQIKENNWLQVKRMKEENLTSEAVFNLSVKERRTAQTIAAIFFLTNLALALLFIDNTVISCIFALLNSVMLIVSQIFYSKFRKNLLQDMKE